MKKLQKFGLVVLPSWFWINPSQASWYQLWSFWRRNDEMEDMNEHDDEIDTIEMKEDKAALITENESLE